MIAGGLLGAVKTGGEDSALEWALRLVAIALYAGGQFGVVGLTWLLQGPATRGLFALWTRELDQRQRAVCDQAFRRAHLPVVGIAFIAALALFAAGVWLPAAGPDLGDRFDVGFRLFFSLFIPSVYAMSALPAAIGAWTGPDERP